VNYYQSTASAGLLTSHLLGLGVWICYGARIFLKMLCDKMQAIDLFSGAGGMSIGASMSGIEVRYAVELDKHAAATFELNHKSTTLLNQDIRKVTATQFRNLGGFKYEVQRLT
jgi:predicted RNA methylase